MNKEQFLNYLQKPGSLDGAAASSLEDLLKEFPYCQSARILHLKALHNEKSILYPGKLKLTAAFAADRKVLYKFIMQDELINKISQIEKGLSSTEGIKTSETAISGEKEIGSGQIPEKAILPEEVEKTAIKVLPEPDSENLAQEKEKPERKETPEIQNEIIDDGTLVIEPDDSVKTQEEHENIPTPEAPVKETEALGLTPREEIGSGEETQEKEIFEEKGPSGEAREKSLLTEIFDNNKPGQQSGVNEEIRESRLHQDESSQTIIELEKEILKEAINVSIGLEFGTGDEPAIGQTNPAEFSETPSYGEKTGIEVISSEETKSGKHSFSEWMKILKERQSREEEHPKQLIPENREKPAEVENTAKSDNRENVPAPNTGDGLKAEQTGLIEKFIKEEPKIKPRKTEFFSPVNMAKLSLVEDNSFVTETLAKVYAKQGNYAKAIKAYENLILKYPEKTAYFAAQLKEIKDKTKK